MSVERPQAMRPLMLALVLITFAWRVQGLDTQSLWRDEVDAIYFAVRDLPDTLAMFVQAGQNGVLYFLGLRPWFRVVGADEVALRFPSAWFGVLTVPLIWQVARRLLGDPRDPPPEPVDPCAPLPPPVKTAMPLWRHVLDSAPFLAALLLAANPYQLWYSQEGKMYTLVTALTLASSWAWLQGISRGGWRPWLAYLVTVSLSIYSHLLMVLVIPLHLVWFLLAWPRSRLQWRGYGLALAGLTLPYLPMIWWQWDLLTTTEKKTGFNFTPLRDVLETLLLNHSRGFMPPGDLIWLAPIFFLGIAGLAMGVWEMGDRSTGTLGLAAWRRFALVVSWLLLPILMIHLLSYRQPIFTARYIIWIAPAAMMLLALGLRLVWRNAGLLATPLMALLLIYVLGFWLYAGWQQKTLPIKYDLRGAVTYIAARREADDLLILQIPHMEYAYRYYSGDQGTHPLTGSDERLGWWMPGLWTNNGLADADARQQVDAAMQSATAGATDVWVLRSEVEMWDPRYLMDNWLDANGELVEFQDFQGAQVRHYRLE